MIPFTFPSSPSLVTGNAECKIFYLSSVTGLAAWKDYIPVRSYTSSSPVEGTTDAAGYQAVSVVSSTTGLAAWTDYIPVYEDASLTKPWSTDAGGYIPVGAAGSRLSLNFAGTTAIDSRITFTRASNATYFNSSGVLTTAGNNVARLDYDPATLLPRGLLVEEQRTNIVTQSNDAGGASWSSASIASIDNTTSTAPDGTASAVQVTTSGANGVRYRSTAPTSYTLAAWTSSGFLKYVSGGSSTLRFICAGQGAFGGTGGDRYVEFNATTGEFVAKSAEVTTYTIQDCGGGWWRVSGTFTPTSAATANVGFGSTVTATKFQYWGYQSELGSFPTSYIPTTTASATRSADSASMTGTNFSSWYNQTQGTFVVEFDTVQSAPTATRRAIEVNDATDANRMLAGVTTLSNVRYLTTTGGSGNIQADLNQSVSAGGVITAAIAYSNNNFALSADGTSPSPDTSGTVPTVDRLMIGYTPSGAANAMLNGHIRRLQFYSVALPSATLQALTS